MRTGTEGRRERGFTLIELLTALVIASLLLAVATPSFRTWNSNRRMAEISYDLVTDLVLARSESLKLGSGANVTLSPVAGDWTKGWRITATVVTDTSTLPYTTKAVTLRTRSALGDTVSVSPGPASIGFNSNGRPTSAGVTKIGLASSAKNVSPRCITIDPSGRPRSVKASCS
jgi:type IV fimbrial biogenesis protein FimT